MRFSEEEATQLFKAWLAISFAFGVVLSGGVGSGNWQNFFLAAFTVGVAFLLHEIAHKAVAQNFGCWAEFRSFDLGLLLAILMSFAGFVFAAPGAVMIAGLVTTEENGKIAAAGPLTNLALAFFYLILGVVSSPIFRSVPFVPQLVSYGFSINAWLALFNLLPFGPLDGAKVLNWSQGVWLVLTLIASGLVFLF